MYTHPRDSNNLGGVLVLPTTLLLHYLSTCIFFVISGGLGDRLPCSDVYTLQTRHPRTYPRNGYSHCRYVDSANMLCGDLPRGIHVCMYVLSFYR